MTRRRPVFYLLIAVLVLLGIGVGLYTVKARSRTVRASSPSSITSSKPAVIQAQTDLNRTFTFNFGTGKQARQVAYILENAQLQNEIVVNGQQVRSVAGKTFLIINIKIKNDTDQGLRMNTRDYLRMSIGKNSDEWLAPDIHNDPVEIQAISTKPTRLGFPVPDSIHNFRLRIGEITGEKTDIDLEL